MNITKSRVIIGDIFILIVLAAMYSATKGFTENMLAIGLVLLILIARSIFYHVSWYKTTGKIY
jgi:hypothetical protein